jgi:hypothetical protein
MKCFYHPVIDAVGTCAQCHKAACRQCIDDLGAALLCVGCLSLIQKQEQQKEQAITRDRIEIIQRAIKRIRWSWIVGGIGLVFGIFPGIAQGMDVINRNDYGALSVIVLPLILVFFIVLTGYLFWSMFWGAPVVWGWTKKFVARFGVPSFSSSWPVWIILFSCCISVPLSIAIYYSVFGGGFYQYFKCRGVAAGRI